jgi:hypothetical protein
MTDAPIWPPILLVFPNMLMTLNLFAPIRRQSVAAGP